MSPISSRKMRAAVGQLELALLLLAGAGERALLVAEQLRFEQRLGQRRAGDRHERLRGAVAGVVDGARDQLLAGAALALDQHRAAQAGDLVRQVQDLVHLRVLADHVVERGIGAISFLRRMVFSRCRFLTLMMRLTSSEISSGLQGLTMYSCAPSFMAVMAVSTVA